MISNHLKTAIKMLVRNKRFTLINIIGLTLGITASLLIMMYLINELSYEKFQKNRHEIYRVALEWGSEGSKMKFAGVMPALAPAIDSMIPEVETSVRLQKDYDPVFKNKENQIIKENNVFFSDPSIFRIFSFKVIEGNQENVLNDPYSVVISTKVAGKYFGSADPLGQQLMYNDTPLKITGVMEDIPENTHLKCDFFISYSTLKAMGTVVDHPWNSWGNDMTYILMKNKNIPANAIIPRLDEMLKKNAGEWLAARMKFEIQPLDQIHWISDTRGDVGPKGNKAYIYIFLSAVIFVLIIACFNFLNLSISQYMGRMKEVGIRKTSGALRKQIVEQFMTESLVVIVISTVVAAFLFDALSMKLYKYLGTEFVLDKSYFLFLSLLGFSLIVIVGLLAGGYPALYISRFNPVKILKRDISDTYNKINFQKVLIVFQFAISVVLLIGTVCIFRQLNYMRNSKLGFDKENVILLNFSDFMQKENNKYDVLRDELLKNQNIKYVSGAYTLPGINSMMNFSVSIAGDSPNNTSIIQAIPADYDYVRSLGLEIAEGRDFSKEFSTDRNESVILNESAVKALNLKTPIGTRLNIPGDDYKNGVKVIGIVKDFHLQSFHNKINPVVIYINPKNYVSVVLRVSPQNTDATIGYIKSTWNNIYPGSNLSYKYLDTVYNSQYNPEEKTGSLLSVFTILALFISCLGLFGFAFFTVTKRIKEVGIRKVLGANIAGISAQLTRQFVIMILISSLIAAPVAYFLAEKWLQSFAFRVNISWWILPSAIFLELIIVLFTITGICWNTASKNPVEALRYE